EEDIKKTFSFLKEVNPYYAGLGVYNPFPRTALFDQGVQLGLLDPFPSIDHFLKTNPKDLFFKDPNQRVQMISPEKFKKLTEEAMEFFHNHNTNPFNMIRRGLARRRVYFQDPSLLWRDLSKAAGILGFSINH
ncbi:hypothetical protein HYY75_09665, partial [bacterium]|nr:hypothetical protein [bacterium]